MRPTARFVRAIPLGAATLAALLSGCSESGVPASSPALQRGVEGQGTVPAAAPPPPAPVAAARPVSAAEFRGAVPAPAPAVETVPLSEEEDDGRDLVAQLDRAFGLPTQCFPASWLATRPGTITVRVSVVVSVSGRVTRADVGGPAGLPPEGSECLRRHAESLQLPGPIDGAPRTVSTSLSFTVAAPPEAPRAESPAWRLPTGAAAPSVVLPAQVGEGPPPGAAAPGIVLPAQVGEGPAPGAVPPAITLPAQAP